MAEQWLVLLSSAPLLEEVFIGQSGSQRFMDGGFISLLHAVPCLKRLTVVTTTEEMGSLSSPFEDTLVHDYLEMFTIIMDDTDNAKVIRIFSQLFSKIRHRQLPAMRKVVVQSPLFEEGCLDARLILPKEFTDHWVGAIESCADANVQFVNHKGDPIHLWHDRHDIKWRDALIESPKLPRAEEETNQVIRDGDEEEAMECGSDESMDSDSEWYPVADTGWKYHSESDERISDDSEDEAYRYRFQPDLEPIDLDEDSEPERLHYVAMN
ncbi:hypothetical protein FRC17_007313 [Serendipita sp. 399]|nr:hypothetical protein FRC17_007313 [Serendipita sp. 399]